MKWKHPKDGDYRTFRRFAFVPVRVSGYRVWMEWYWVTQMYYQRIDSWVACGYGLTSTQAMFAAARTPEQ